MPIQEGDTVAVHYTGKLEDGQVFDTSEGRGPLEFQVGAGQLIRGFDEAVRGLEVGEETTITVPPEQGYGEPDPQMVQKIPNDRLDAQGVEEGQVLALQADDGRQFQATVKAVDPDGVTLDFNHFLAGKTLVFEIKVLEVKNGATA